MWFDSQVGQKEMEEPDHVGKVFGRPSHKLSVKHNWPLEVEPSHSSRIRRRSIQIQRPSTFKDLPRPFSSGVRTKPTYSRDPTPYVLGIDDRSEMFEELSYSSWTLASPSPDFPGPFPSDVRKTRSRNRASYDVPLGFGIRRIIVASVRQYLASIKFRRDSFLQLVQNEHKSSVFLMSVVVYSDWMEAEFRKSPYGGSPHTVSRSIATYSRILDNINETLQYNNIISPTEFDAFNNRVSAFDKEFKEFAAAQSERIRRPEGSPYYLSSDWGSRLDNLDSFQGSYDTMGWNMGLGEGVRRWRQMESAALQSELVRPLENCPHYPSSPTHTYQASHNMAGGRLIQSERIDAVPRLYRMELAALKSELVRPPENLPHHPFSQSRRQGTDPAQRRPQMEMAALQSELLRPPENLPRRSSSSETYIDISLSVQRSVEDYKQIRANLHEARRSNNTISSADAAALINRANRFIKELEMELALLQPKPVPPPENLDPGMFGGARNFIITGGKFENYQFAQNEGKDLVLLRLSTKILYMQYFTIGVLFG